MRDAQVDSGERDFLAPVGGISPGIHGNQGIHPITPGEVSDDMDTQEAAEVADMLKWQGDGSVDSLAVTPATASVEEAATQQLTATATLADGTSTRDVTDDTSWESDDEETATVDESGLVTGVAAGTATVTGTYKGSSDYSTVTVTSA